MTKTEIFTVTGQENIAKDIYEMTASGDASGLTAPGQFVGVALPGFYLRRPISVCSWGADSLRLIYKVVGRGTAAMAELAPGAGLDLLLPLGNGFSLPEGAKHPLVVGGGVGVPPLYGLCEHLCERGLRPTVVMGFGSGADVFYVKQFEALGCRVEVSTQDGSVGTRGFVTDTAALKEKDHDYYYACGPQGMLKAVHDALGIPGQLSFEERMACGFGACMGCSCKTKYGSKRLCKDGPVLRSDEIVWGGDE